MGRLILFAIIVGVVAGIVLSIARRKRRGGDDY
jgi:hypothetical protein